MRARPSSARTQVAVAPAPATANGHARRSSDPRPLQSAGVLRVSSWRIVLLFRRALRTVIDGEHSGERWEKDDLLDVIYWCRQVLALVMGVTAGVAGLSGWIPLAGFAAGALLLAYSWYQNLRLDEEEYGGHQLLLMEGLMPAIAVFLLSWIIVYNAIHAP
ncbi:hypothetical protein WJX81_002039 [Elliptochloris bilobata]|uniref:Rab5-interacting protein n=1 Tax=Elliptochloris bilobata TaxID=381761 RepID=A0AAW1RPG3_9CHLO